MKWTRQEKWDNAHKKFWVRGDTKEFDEVLDLAESYIPALTSELLDQYEGDRHTQIDQALKRSDVNPVLEDLDSQYVTQEVKDNIVNTGNKKGNQAWQAINVKYGVDIPGKYNLVNYGDKPGDLASCLEDIFPSAKEFLDNFTHKEVCLASYSFLTSNSTIYRHTGVENRKGRYMRVHIPLYVPPGDIFLEANGDEINWDQSFGFNNQFVHSASNNTPEHRLAFIFDIERERIGIPKAMDCYNVYFYNNIRGNLEDEYIRTSKPRPYTGKYQSD